MQPPLLLWFMMVWSGGKPPLPDVSELQGSFYGRGSKKKPHCKDKIFICRLNRLQIFYFFYGEKSHVYIFKVPALHQTDWFFSVRWQWDKTCEVKKKKRRASVLTNCSGKYLGKQTNQIYTQLETGAATTPCTLRPFSHDSFINFITLRNILFFFFSFPSPRFLNEFIAGAPQAPSASDWTVEPIKGILSN